MRIISLNMNGIRAAERKGFYPWLEKQNADVICLQETRIQQHQLTEQMLKPKGMHSFFSAPNALAIRGSPSTARKNQLGCMLG